MFYSTATLLCWLLFVRGLFSGSFKKHI